MNERTQKVLELLITPVVVAIIGISGTYFITQSQISSSKSAAEIQLRIQEKEAKNNRALKILEIFSKHIMSKDDNERLMALGFIRILEPELAQDMLEHIAKHDESELIKSEAKKIKDTVYGSALERNKPPVEKKVIEVLSQLYRVPASQITRSSILEKINPSRNMPGVGDITSIEALVALEGEYSCEIPDDAAEDIKTVADMILVFKTCTQKKK